MSNANEVFGSRDRQSTALYAAAVTPSDSTDLPFWASALWIGGAGSVVLDTVGGNTEVVIAGVAAGTTLPIAAKRVRATGTTATLIVALA
jgi:hypothetical protein